METMEKMADVSITYNKISLHIVPYGYWKGGCVTANSIALESERPGFDFQLHHFLAWAQTSSEHQGAYVCK